MIASKPPYFMARLPNSEMRNRKNIFEIILGFSILLLSISHWFPFGIHLLELLGAFAHFSLAISALAIAVSLYLKQKVLGVLSTVSLLISASLVFPHLLPLNSSEKGSVTVGQFNLYHNNPSPEAAISELKRLHVDVFTIQELNTDWKAIIDSVFHDQYPYRIEEPWDDCCYGIGLYSKYPIIESAIFKTESTPSINATINIARKVLRVISFHTKPPAFPNETKERNKQMRIIAKMAAETETPLIALGDLNVVPWDTKFQSFLKAGDLNAVRDGFQATYPMDFGIPLIPIDHITYSNGLIPTSCEAIKIPGSDHKGMVASFKFE